MRRGPGLLDQQADPGRGDRRAGARLTAIDKVLVERRDHVTVMTLNRPEVHNCVDSETAAGIETAIDAFASDADAWVLVVTGAGGKAFCSGADLKTAASLLTRPGWERSGPMGFARLDPGKPTIAAVEGYCFAGGLELAAWCDFRVASESSEFGALNRRWGVPFVDGGTQRFARIMGQGNALYLLETGARLSARRASELGFVQEVVPAAQALPRALELAAAMAAYPQASIRQDRAATLEFAGPLDAGLLRERELVVPTLAEDEMQRGLQRFRDHDRPEPPAG
jgi:enoyl-CoA hydratase